MFACWWGIVGPLIFLAAMVFVGFVACVLVVLNSDTDLEL